LWAAAPWQRDQEIAERPHVATRTGREPHRRHALNDEIAPFTVVFAELALAV
jgi:hypothetical protein